MSKGEQISLVVMALASLVLTAAIECYTHPELFQDEDPIGPHVKKITLIRTQQ